MSDTGKPYDGVGEMREGISKGVKVTSTENADWSSGHTASLQQRKKSQKMTQLVASRRKKEDDI